MSLTDQEIDAIADRVVAKMLTAKPQPQPAADATSAEDIITSAEAKSLLRVSSPAAFCRLLKKLKVKRVCKNKYRRGDIENAVARATMLARRTA